MCARPLKINDEIIDRIYNALSVGSPVEIACNYAGISRDSYFRWIKAAQTEKGEKGALLRRFADAVKKGEAACVLKNLKEIAEDKSWTAKAWVLERRYPQYFSKHIKVGDSDDASRSLRDAIFRIKDERELLRIIETGEVPRKLRLVKGDDGGGKHAHDADEDNSVAR